MMRRSRRRRSRRKLKSSKRRSNRRKSKTILLPRLATTSTSKSRREPLTWFRRPRTNISKISTRKRWLGCSALLTLLSMRSSRRITSIWSKISKSTQGLPRRLRSSTSLSSSMLTQAKRLRTKRRNKGSTSRSVEKGRKERKMLMRRVRSLRTLKRIRTRRRKKMMELRRNSLKSWTMAAMSRRKKSREAAKLRNRRASGNKD